MVYSLIYFIEFVGFGVEITDQTQN